MLYILEIHEYTSNYCLFGSFILTPRGNCEQNSTVKFGYRCAWRYVYLEDGGQNGAIEEDAFGECICFLGIGVVLVDECDKNIENGPYFVVIWSWMMLFLSEIGEIVSYFIFELGLAGNCIPLPIYFDQVSETYNIAIQF